MVCTDELEWLVSHHIGHTTQNVTIMLQEATALLTSGYAMVPVPRNNVFEGYYVASAGYIVQAEFKTTIEDSLFQNAALHTQIQACKPYRLHQIQDAIHILELALQSLRSIPFKTSQIKNIGNRGDHLGDGGEEPQSATLSSFAATAEFSKSTTVPWVQAGVPFNSGLESARVSLRTAIEVVFEARSLIDTARELLDKRSASSFPNNCPEAEPSSFEVLNFFLRGGSIVMAFYLLHPISKGAKLSDLDNGIKKGHIYEYKDQCVEVSEMIEVSAKAKSLVRTIALLQDASYRLTEVASSSALAI